MKVTSGNVLKQYTQSINQQFIAFFFQDQQLCLLHFNALKRLPSHSLKMNSFSTAKDQVPDRNPQILLVPTPLPHRYNHSLHVPLHPLLLSSPLDPWGLSKSCLMLSHQCIHAITFIHVIVHLTASSRISSGNHSSSSTPSLPYPKGIWCPSSKPWLYPIHLQYLSY